MKLPYFVHTRNAHYSVRKYVYFFQTRDVMQIWGGGGGGGGGGGRSRVGDE